jgi:hypothetical protein
MKHRVVIGGVALVGVGVLAGMVGPEVTVLKTVRARSYEIWDASRGGKVCDIEAILASMERDIDKLAVSIAEVRVLAEKGYKASGAERQDANALAAAQMNAELARIRESLDAARRQAQDQAERDRIDRLIRDSQRDMSGDELTREVRRLRKELERP